MGNSASSSSGVNRHTGKKLKTNSSQGNREVDTLHSIAFLSPSAPSANREGYGSRTRGDGGGGATAPMKILDTSSRTGTADDANLANSVNKRITQKANASSTVAQDSSYGKFPLLTTFSEHPTVDATPSSDGSLARGISRQKANELFEEIFNPMRGELECVASGFISTQQYGQLCAFISPFLSLEEGGVWQLDAVTVAVTGGEQWTAADIQPTLPGRRVAPEAKHLNSLRRECTDALRALLLSLSGARPGHSERTGKGPLPLLVREYRRLSIAAPPLPPPPPSSGGQPEQDGEATSPTSLVRSAKRGRASGAPVRSPRCLSATSKYALRLRGMSFDSFTCQQIIARRIPIEVLSMLPREYWASSSPIMWDKISFKEKGVVDTAQRSFFVSLHERVQLLGLWDGKSATDYHIRTGDCLYAAMRNLGHVFTTAFSHLITFVLLHVADGIRLRREFRKLQQAGRDETASAESLLGRRVYHTTYSGAEPTFQGATIDDWKDLAMTGEISLTVLTQLLIARYYREHEQQVADMKQSNKDLFTYLEAVTGTPTNATNAAATPTTPTTAKKDVGTAFNASRRLGNATLKLMYMLAGGQRSIEADDRRMRDGSQPSPDDVNLSRMLEIPILDRICWVACMLGMPVMVGRDALLQKHQNKKPWSYIEFDECSGVLRELFQAVGALPPGTQCPNSFETWLRLFPLYAVNIEGKRLLMYLYCAQASAVKPLPLVVQKDMVLISFSESLGQSKGFDRQNVCSYEFEPAMTTGNVDDCLPQSETRSSTADRKEERVSSFSEARHSTVSDNATSKRSDDAGDDRNNKTNNDDDSASVSSSSSSSVSTLMDSNANIDVYTCVSPSAQLYLRSANEAVVRRHKETELTPFVDVHLFTSIHELHSRRDLHTRYKRMRLLPSEGLLVLRWTVKEPMVTFQAGDHLYVGLGQARGSGFNLTGKAASCPAPSPCAPASNSRANRPQIVGFDDTATNPHDSMMAHTPLASCRRTPSLLLQRRASAGSVGSLESEYTNVYFGNSFQGEIPSERDSVVSAGSTGGLWNVVTVLLSHSVDSLRSTSGRSPSLQVASGGGDGVHVEVVLHVRSSDYSQTEPVRVLAISHARASISPFFQLGDGVACWTNPLLTTGEAEAAMAESEAEAAADGASSCSGLDRSQLPSFFLAGPMAQAQQEGHALTRTTAELRHIFFSIGVLLANAIANAVFFSIPIAPLAFMLFKKAISSGDHSFSTFTWLEPADGNMLSTSTVLNAALEVLMMSDMEYYALLESRNLARPDRLPYPVFNRSSTAEKSAGVNSNNSNDCHGSRSPSPQLSPTHRPKSAALPDSSSSQCFGGSLLMEGSASWSDVLLRSQPRTPFPGRSLAQMYIQAIWQRNCDDSVIRSKKIDFSKVINMRSSGSSKGVRGNATVRVHEENNGGNSAPVSDGSSPTPATLQGTTTHRHHQVPSPPKECGIRSCIQERLRHLPSRHDYVALYLVNDLAWGSTFRNEPGTEAAALWVSMAKGFMTNPIARSPLMSHCCARVVREVLCVPNRPGKWKSPKPHHSHGEK